MCIMKYGVPAIAVHEYIVNNNYFTNNLFLSI